MSFESDLGETVFKQQVRMYWRNAQDEWIENSSGREALKNFLNKMRTDKFNNSSVVLDEEEVIRKLRILDDEVREDGLVIRKSPFVCVGETSSKELILMTLVSTREEGRPFPKTWFRLAVPICSSTPIEGKGEEGETAFTHFAVLSIDSFAFGPFVQDLMSCKDLSQHRHLDMLWKTYLSCAKEAAENLARDFHAEFNKTESEDWWS